MSDMRAKLLPLLGSRGARVGTRLGRPRNRPRWGNLRRQRPFSDDYGFDRGRPIDRVYIEGFLQRHANDVRGSVLEVNEPLYAFRYGAARVANVDVLDIDATNREATVIADLGEAASLPAEAYDCFIMTQTLQLVSNPEAALENAWRTLAPGGTLLLTVPVITRVDATLREVDRWRFTPSGLRMLVERTCPEAALEVVGYGNLTAALAFLLGLAASELREWEFLAYDGDYALVACARVEKGAA